MYQLNGALGIQPRMKVVAKAGGRTGAAQSEAVNRRDPHPIAGSVADGPCDPFHPACLASFRAAQLQAWTKIRGRGEVVVEAHDPVHLGAAEIERERNGGLRFGIDAPPDGLDFMQQRQQQTFGLPVRGEEIPDLIGDSGQDTVSCGADDSSRSACQPTCSARKVEMK